MEGEEGEEEVDEVTVSGDGEMGTDGADEEEVEDENKEGEPESRMPEDADDEWKEESEDEAEGYEMSQGEGAELFGVEDGEDVPPAVAVVVAGECAVGLAGKVGAVGVGDDDDFASSVDDAFVEFDVLVADEALVIEAVFLEDSPWPAAERDGIDFADAVYACAEGGVAYAETVAEDLNDGKGLGGFVDDVGSPDAADILGIVFDESASDGGEVVGFVGGMGVKAHDDLATGCPDADVHGIGGVSLGVVEEMDEWVALGVGADDVAGFVAAHAVDQKEFIVVLVVLLEDGVETAGYVALLVVDGDDYGKHDFNY